MSIQLFDIVEEMTIFFFSKEFQKSNIVTQVFSYKIYEAVQLSCLFVCLFLMRDNKIENCFSREKKINATTTKKNNDMM